MSDTIGSAIKECEKKFSPQLDPYAGPIIVRLDGRAFHTFTKGLNRPFDERLAKCMWEATIFVLEQTHAKIAYTQSDEISLLYEYNEPSQAIFGGKLNKVNSVLASMVTAKFNNSLGYHLSEKTQLAQFDCRTFQVPNRKGAVDTFTWRYMDAQRNSVSMAAQSHFSHKQLQRKSTREQIKLLSEIDVDFNDYPCWFRHGVFFKREKVCENIAADKLALIPENHRPSGPVIRSKTIRNSIPFLLEQDKESYLFGS